MNVVLFSKLKKESGLKKHLRSKNILEIEFCFAKNRQEIKKEPPANFKITVDNITIDVPPGTTILNAARMIGGEIAPPAMCYYSKLEGSGGKCRTCLVEVAAGST